jgi:hypothetical protein
MALKRKSTPPYLRGILVGLALLTMNACSNDGSRVLDTSNITGAELASMVLTADDLSALGSFQLDGALSGVRSTDDILEDSFDPQRDAQDLREFGRLTGYFNSFTKKESESPAGVFFAGAGVNLFETAEGANLSLDNDIQNAILDIGKSNGSATLVAADALDIEALDDGFTAISLMIDTSGDGHAEYSNTLVAFTLGRLLGVVSVASVDLDAELAADASKLAEMLRDRVVSVVESQQS